MNENLKKFLHRGLMFAGFGPIVLGIVFLFIDTSIENFSLSGKEILLGIITTYILAFVQAGASVFNQIEDWPITKSLLCHFSLLFVTYSLCYIINSWIPFEPTVLLIFSVIFIVTYLIIWMTVYLIVRATSKKFNAGLRKSGNQR